MKNTARTYFGQVLSEQKGVEELQLSLRACHDSDESIISSTVQLAPGLQKDLLPSRVLSLCSMAGSVGSMRMLQELRQKSVSLSALLTW